ncbi:MAG TPA: energy transducer TonB [Burkholderiales bacterium]|nr:energy transducer TonB [Burkholderiales bacterium]
MSDNRGFYYAVAASLALHALVLFAFPELIDTARRAASIPPQIIARLMEPEPAPPVAVPAPPVQPRPPAPAEKKKVPEAKKPAPVISTPQPAPTPAAPSAPPPVVAEAPAPQPAPPLAAVEPQRAPQPPPQPAQPPESLSRDQYRLQLIDEARRHKRYPPLARENNWQGDVRVDVAIGANGRPTVTLKGSSGYDVLDRQALEMFAQAARAVPVPPALRGKEFTLELRAVYGLED